MLAQTKALCDAFMNTGIPSIDLIVYHNGNCIMRYMQGFADPEKKIPISGKEKYHIYSCSKLITCTAAMQLWEKGMFSLEDKLSTYIPEFGNMTVQTESGVRPAKNPILIRNLFEMTSGIGSSIQTPELQAYYASTGYRCPTVETVRQFAKMPLAFDPGEGWKYGFSHDVLAALVEILSGQKFENYVKEHIFDPLGMENTDFLHDQEDWEGFANHYSYDINTNTYTRLWANTYRPGTEYASGGAGCVSTVEDYSKFLEALRKGELLQPETLRMMGADRLTEQQRSMYVYNTEDIGYGLGMRGIRSGSKRTEFGWDGAAGAFASIDLENNVTIYFAQHTRSSPVKPYLFTLYDVVIADIKGQTYPLPTIQVAEVKGPLV